MTECLCDKPRIGSCIVCTYNEIRRYEMLYNEAARALVAVSEARQAQFKADRLVERQLERFGRELASH